MIFSSLLEKLMELESIEKQGAINLDNELFIVSKNVLVTNCHGKEI